MQSTSDESEHSSEEETVDSSDTIGCPSTNEATNDGTEIVLQIQISLQSLSFMKGFRGPTHDTNDTSLLGGIGHGTIGGTDVDFSNVVRRGIDTAHDTLIISFEEDRDQSKRLDGDVELSRREPLPCSSETHGFGNGDIDRRMRF